MPGLENFSLNDKNPNDTVGGKGCLCHPEGECADQHGPFVIFHAASTDEVLSPHAVVCAGCIHAAHCQLERASDSEGEVLSAGED